MQHKLELSYGGFDYFVIAKDNLIQYIYIFVMGRTGGKCFSLDIMDFKKDSPFAYYEMENALKIKLNQPLC
ncbi:MAG: hypothetical protein KA319_14160 [Ferruginibacter sp.]|nr:hypothetical protein [Ferruginibacter sp.]